MALLFPYPIGATMEVTGYSEMWDSLSASALEIYVVFSLTGIARHLAHYILVVIILGNAQNFKRSNTIHKKAASNAKQDPFCENRRKALSVKFAVTR